MGWRTVIVDSAAKLSYKNGYLVVKKEEDVLIHLSEIDVLVVATTQASFTCVAIAELTKNKVKVIFCDEKYNPLCETVAYYGAYNVAKKTKNQISWMDENKKKVFAELIKRKIRNQATLLMRYGEEATAKRLFAYAEEVMPGDETNREGLAAKAYFPALFGSEFLRETDCAINQALNYGYAILLSYINREVVANGYLTQLGLKHNNEYNEFNLSCDIIEPFRQIVDEYVSVSPPSTVIDKEYKYKLIGILDSIVLFDDKKTYFNNVLSEGVRSILNAVGTGDIHSLKLYEL